MAYYDRFTKKPANKREDLRDDTKTQRPMRDGRPPLPEQGQSRFAQDHAQRTGAGRFAGPKEGSTGAGRFAAPKGERTGMGRFGAPKAERTGVRTGVGRFAGPKTERVTNRPAYGPVKPEAQTEELQENLLVGRNPIREALKSGRDLEKLLIARGELIGSGREIVAMAREQKVIVQEVDRAKLDAMAPGHQGMIAVASAYRYSTIDDMLALAASRGEAPFLVILDGITDPHNLGAIIRSAECAGAHGVIVPERRAVGLTPAAVKASAGAVEYIPVSRETNLTRTLERLKKEGIWIFGADMSGADYRKADFSCPAALVIGSEGEGLSRLVRENCDMIVSLPVKGKIDSLNASVAAGILLYAMSASRD